MPVPVRNRGWRASPRPATQDLVTDYWQHFEPAAPDSAAWQDAVPMPMPDGSRLVLPLRDYGEIGVTGLIANQASFPVLRALAGWMAAAVHDRAPEIVVGVPTLGHVLAASVAESLGHPHWVAAGYSRKLWYDDALSVEVASSTSPTSRKLWLDPRMLPRLAGRRVLLVDDVIATGRSAEAGLALLAKAGIAPVALGVAMAQGDRWRASWPAAVPVRAAFATPLFRRTPAGWVPRPDTCPRDCCPLFG